MKRFLVFILLFVQGLYAQVQFTAEPDRTTIGLDERLRIDFNMTGDGDNFVAPTFAGFNASGPMINIRNYWINNKHSYSKIYTFFLQPKKKGTFTIGPAFVEIDNKRYKTAPFKVTVTDAAPAVPEFEPETGAGLYLVAEVNKTNPYVNEAVSVVYRLYVGYKADVRNYSISETPKYNDFWSQRLEGDHTAVRTGIYKGQEYNYVELMPTVLYPQKSGALEIDPLSLEVILDVPTGQVDFFGDPVVRQERKILRAEKRIINVKALPDSGRPESFTGAVGSFDFKVVPSKTTVSGGQAIELTLSSEGRGNLKLFQLPKAAVPAGLEAYDPVHSEDVNVPITGMQGRITDKYNIIAQKKGKYTIAPIAFSYFDPAAGSYKTISSAPIEVNVLSDASAEDMAAAASAENNKPQFKANAEDTRFRRIDKKDFFGSMLFYILIALPFALIPVIVVARRKKEVLDSDVAGNKKKQTNKLAKKYLSEAKAAIGNKEPFYVALERALHNFLRAKLSIETVDMSKQNIRDLLSSRNVDAATVDKFITIMNNCEFARYAPSTDAAMQQDYDLAETVMTSLEKQL
ncbi:MAG: BatD family protein [Flavobacterium sp.]